MYKKPLLCITFFFLRVILSVLLYYIAARARKLRKGCPQGEKKYSVYKSCLRERFKVCVKCLAQVWVGAAMLSSRNATKTLGPWSSQPYMVRKPAGNIDLFTGILFSGWSHAPALRMICLMNLWVISECTFHEYQDAYLVLTVQTVGAYRVCCSHNVIS